MTPETRFANEIKYKCGLNNMVVIRLQSGLFYDRDGNPIRIGFEGLSDYLVIDDKGNMAFAELKVEPNKPSSEQIEFIEKMKKRNQRAGVIYSFDELLDLFR